METNYEIVEISVIGVFNRKSHELENVVYHNEETRAIVVCEVKPSGWDDFKTLFNSLINSKKKDE